MEGKNIVISIVIVLWLFVILSDILDFNFKIHFMTQEQKSCHHDWRDIHIDSKHLIYCPKCKLEKRITHKEWLEMQIDKEYQEENK